MSLISLSQVAIDRDKASPTPGAAENPQRPSIAGFGPLLVAQIPSEAIVAYAALLAVFGAGGSQYRTGRWVLYGVVVALCPIVVITGYLAKRSYGFVEPARALPAPAIVPNPLDIVSPATDAEVGAVADSGGRAPLHLPILPAAAGAAAMAVFGLALPGCALQYTISNVAFGIIAGCLAVGGAVMMAIVAPYLGHANRARVATPTE
jgi:hypothetical protein